MYMCMCVLHGGCVCVCVCVHTYKYIPFRYNSQVGHTHNAYPAPGRMDTLTFQNTHTFSTYSPCRTNEHIYVPPSRQDTHYPLCIHLQRRANTNTYHYFIIVCVLPRGWYICTRVFPMQRGGICMMCPTCAPHQIDAHTLHIGRIHTHTHTHTTLHVHTFHIGQIHIHTSCILVCVSYTQRMVYTCICVSMLRVGVCSYVFYLKSCMCFLTRRLYAQMCVIPTWYIHMYIPLSR